MRVYAMLLGAILTVGTAYLAEVAVASATTSRPESSPREAQALVATDPIWYGGTLDPVTIEARGGVSRSVTLTHRDSLIESPRVGRAAPRYRGYRARSSAT